MRVGRVCARAVVAATAGDAIAGRRREDCAFVESLSSVAHRPPPPVTENHPLYIDGTKIYGVGILEDPIRGSKRGKGMQHLTSSYWLYDMGTFIHREFEAMRTMAAYARAHTGPGAAESFDFHYFVNASNALFLKAEAEGLRTADGRDFFLMACWLAMAAAEVDGFRYLKYSVSERRAHREAFYAKYEFPQAIWDPEQDAAAEAKLGKYAIECPRIDLIPTVALERLGVHNELCEIKWGRDAGGWMTGDVPFDVPSRMASCKRHYESIHARDATEDHVAHLIWGFMAIVHVVAIMPHKNTLANYEELRRKNVLRAGCEDLVGDGGFRRRLKERRSQQPDLVMERLLANGSTTDQGVATVPDATGADADRGQDPGELFRVYGDPPATDRTFTAGERAALAGTRRALKARQTVHRDGDWHRSVDVWVHDPADGAVLLQVRSQLKDTNPGKLDVSCAGHLSRDDEPRATAIKELQEELGLADTVDDLGDDLVHAFAAPYVCSGATAAHGPFVDREIVDVFLLRWTPAVAEAFGAPGARLNDAVFKVGVGEVAALRTMPADAALARLEDKDASFVPRADFYVAAVRAALRAGGRAPTTT